jgi:hypothetical protein
MDLSSPWFIVPLIVVLFTALILFATSTKEDGNASH